MLVSTEARDIENPLLATYTAAWMAVFLGGAQPGTAPYQLVFGGGSSNETVYMCDSQEMAECVTVPL